MNPTSLFKAEQLRKLGNSSRVYFGDPTYGTLRRSAAAGIGAVAAVNLLDINTLNAKQNINSLAFLAGHGAIGMGLMSMGGVPRVAGMAYLGATAINTFRKGNNIGPM